MRKIVYTVLFLVVAVLMALSGFVFYAWMVQKRTKDAATWIKNSQIITDQARAIASLDNSYTYNTRGYLLSGDNTLPPLERTIPDSIQQLLQRLMTLEQNNTAQEKKLVTLQQLLQEKVTYTRMVLQTATLQPEKARQLISAPQTTTRNTSIQNLLNNFLQTEQQLLIQRVDKDSRYTNYSFWFTLLISIFTLIILSGEARYIFNLFKKIKTWGNNLLKSEQSFKRLAEEAEQIIFKASSNGHFTYVSQRAADITGYPGHALIGKHYSIFLEDEVYEDLQAFYQLQKESGEDYSSKEFEIITKTGAKKWVEQLATVIRHDDGTVKEFQCIVKDIDNERRNDEHLAYLQKRLEAILDYMPSMMFVKDMPGKYLLVNNRFAEIMQVDKNDIIGKTDADLDYPWIARYAESDRKILAGSGREKLEETITANGKTYHFMITKFPLRNANNEMIGICSIGTDFTEKMNYIRQEQEARQLAENAKKAQEVFLANMSHEIRTPMHGIVGMTHLLLQDGSLSAQQAGYVGAIRKSASNLLVIINEILDFSKIIAGKLQVNSEPFNIYEVTDNTLFPLKLQAEKKKIYFFTEIDKDIPAHLLGDAGRLSQVLINLVENAIKFTNTGSVSVKISLAGTDKDNSRIQLRFEIKDTGIGIPADKQSIIFESFSQSHSSNNREFGGTGLGLAICKELIALQHGVLGVQSEVGEGSLFYFELPFTRNPFPPPSKQERSPRSIAGKPLLGKTILVVEDNTINQQVALYTLQYGGANADIAGTGNAALELLNSKPYDCIIMDLQMPGMDGYEATRIIRNTGIQTCVIAVTASALEGEKERCLEAGMNDYVSKPFEPEELFQKILMGIGEAVPHPIEKQKTAAMPLLPIDFKFVFEMVSNDRENVKLLLEELIKVVPEKLAELNVLVQEEKWEDAFMLAHQLKSNFDIVRMHEAVQLARSVERDARLQNNLQEIPWKINEMAALFNRYRPLIEEQVRKLTASS